MIRLLIYLVALSTPVLGNELVSDLGKLEKLTDEKPRRIEPIFELLKRVSVDSQLEKLPEDKQKSAGFLITQLLYVLAQPRKEADASLVHRLYGDFIRDPKVSSGFRRYALRSLRENDGASAEAIVDLLVNDPYPESFRLALLHDVAFEKVPGLQRILDFFPETDDPKAKDAHSTLEYWAGRTAFTRACVASPECEKKLGKQIVKLFSSPPSAQELALSFVSDMPEQLRGKYLDQVFRLFAKKFETNERDESASLGEQAQQILDEASPAALSPFVPQLVALSKRTLAEEKSQDVYRALAATQSPEAVSILLEGFRSPLNPDVPFEGRALVRSAGYLLLDVLKARPTLKTPALERQLNKILESREPGLSAARAILRSSYSPEEKTAYETQLARRLIHPQNASVCRTQCNFFDFFSGLLDKVQFSSKMFERDTNAAPYSMAVKSKIAEFLYRAAPSCKAPEMRTKVLHWVSAPIEEAKPKTDSRVGEIAVLRDVSERNGSLSQLEAFLKQVEQNSLKDGSPRSSSSIFAYAHLAQLLEIVGKSPSEADENIAINFAHTQTTLKFFLGQHKSLAEENRGPGSVMAAYHTSVASLSYAGPNSTTVPTMKVAVERAMGQYGSPCAIGYNLMSPTFGDSPEARLAAIRGGAARAIPLHLALLERDAPEFRATHKKNLMTCLENYVTYFYDFFEGRGEFRAHDSGDDDLAPYFGPATVSYALLAAHKLSEDSSLTPADRGRARSAANEITTRLLSLLTPKGLLPPQNARQYDGAEHYENAFAALALVDACEMGLSPGATESFAGSPAKNHGL